jgi:hypothetical protein
MSLLQQDGKEERDDAALGEELTKGTSHLLAASVAAAVVVTIIIAVYVIAGQKPPLATGQVVGVWAHPLHTESSGFDAAGMPMPKETFDQVLVFAQVRLHNQSKQPLFLTNILANATFGDGVHSSYAAGASEYKRVFLAYPHLGVPQGNPLPLEETLNPGQTVEGSFVCAFHMAKQQWDTRKNLSFTFTMLYEPNLVLTPSAAIVER